MNKELEKFYEQGILEINQIQPNDHFRNYRMKDTEQVIFEVNIDSGLGGEEVNIAMMNDMHINYCDEVDETDEEVMYTKARRWWNANGSSIVPVDNAMDAAQYFDQTVIAGDTMDLLAHGTMELTKKHVFDRDPNVLIPVGSHEFSKQVGTGVSDKMTLDERREIVRKFWIHDIHYATKDVKDKVICVGVDNSAGYYYDGVAEKLQAEVERARKENKIILLFQHEPLSTGVPEDEKCRALYAAYMDVSNFYDKDLIYSKKKPLKHDDEKMYEVLKNSTDVIKGVFAGHLHSLFYNEINFDNGKRLPQYTCVGNTYFGYAGVITRIIVK